MRSTFDTSETQKSFGVCVIDYEQVQARVNAKYDAWQRDILSRFGTQFGEHDGRYAHIYLNATKDLENLSRAFDFWFTFYIFRIPAFL